MSANQTSSSTKRVANLRTRRALLSSRGAAKEAKTTILADRSALDAREEPARTDKTHMRPRDNCLHCAPFLAAQGAERALKRAQPAGFARALLDHVVVLARRAERAIGRANAAGHANGEAASRARETGSEARDVGKESRVCRHSLGRVRSSQEASAERTARRARRLARDAVGSAERARIAAAAGRRRLERAGSARRALDGAVATCEGACDGNTPSGIARRYRAKKDAVSHQRCTARTRRGPHSRRRSRRRRARS